VIPGGYHEKNTVRHFGKQSAHRCGPTIFWNAPRDLMLWKHAYKYTKKIWGFLWVWSAAPDEHSYKMKVPKTLTLKQIHTSDTKNNLGSLQVWSFHLMNIPMKCENNEVPKKLTLKQIHPHLIQEPLSMSITSKVVSKLFSYPCLGLFQCLSPPK
jgi:hypothetical protein